MSIFLGQLMLWLQINQGGRLFVGFSHYHTGRKLAAQHRQTFFNKRRHQLLRQTGSGLELVDDDAFHLQLVIVIFASLLNVFQ